MCWKCLASAEIVERVSILLLCSKSTHVGGTACRIVFEQGDVWRGEGHQYYTACTDAAVEMYVVFKEYSSSISIGTEKMCVALGLPKKH